jgi:hypothetical protein
MAWRVPLHVLAGMWGWYKLKHEALGCPVWIDLDVHMLGLGLINIYLKVVEMQT